MPTKTDFILIQQTLAASAAAVFDAWVNPSVMKQWMFLTGDNEIYKVQVDVRVGGAYSILEWTGSQDIDHFGHYLKIDQPNLLSFSFQAPKHFKARTTITITIETQDDLTKLTFHQTGIGPSVVKKPWLMMFDTLAKLLGDDRTAKARGVEVEGSG
jgi:uncharacterized protein YndB with AHSA1/START domain